MKESVTISIEADVLEIARAEVRAGDVASVSAAIERALTAHKHRKDKLPLSERDRLNALREALELSDAEHGPLSEEMEAWGIRELRRAFRDRSLTSEGADSL